MGKNAKFYTNVRILIAFVRRLCYNFLKGDKLISYKYDAWGNFTTTYHNGCTASSTAAKNPFRYRGYYYDVDLEMYYLQSRYYDPVIGRFISADKYISTGQGLLGHNMYAYCGNNPITRIDRNGNDWEDFWGVFEEFVDTVTYAIEDLYYLIEEAVVEKIELCIEEPFAIGEHFEAAISFGENLYDWFTENKEYVDETVLMDLHKDAKANAIVASISVAIPCFAIGGASATATAGISAAAAVKLVATTFLTTYAANIGEGLIRILLD